MGKVLKITYGGIELFDGEVGKFDWSEPGNGGIRVSAEPPRVPGQPGQLNPALQAISSELKAGAQRAAAKAAATPPAEKPAKTATKS